MEFKDNSKHVKQKLKTEAEKRLAAACLHIRDKIAERLTGQRSGRLYRVPGTKRFYRASAPGEPPAVRFGRLRASIRYQINNKELCGEVGTDLEYAVNLELGTKKMAPRPFFRVTFEAEEEKIKEILSRRWE